ncbi:MAG: DMT family transporter [Aromatoleum sp.]|nr:DMT family transporter [Aromatoleum sp.]
MSARQIPLSGVLKLALVALIWGGTFIAGRIATMEMSPATAALWRYLIACAALVIAAFALEGGLPRLSQRQWVAVTLLGATGVFAYNLCFMFGMKTVAAGRASLIVALNPAMIMLGSALILRERIEARKVLGIAIALAGAAIVIGRGNPLALLSGAAGTGEALMFGCALSWMAFTLIAKRVMRGLSPLAMTTYASLLGTVMLALAVTLTGAEFIPHFSPAGAVALVFLGVLGTAVAFVWFNDGVRVLGPSRAAVFINLVPVAAVTLGVLLLGETVDAPVIAGGALVVTGVWLLNRAPRVVPVPVAA